jgi:hypothetical protein
MRGRGGGGRRKERHRKEEVRKRSTRLLAFGEDLVEEGEDFRHAELDVFEVELIDVVFLL